MSRDCEFPGCYRSADYVFFVPKGRSLGLSSMVCASVRRVDIDTIYDDWQHFEYYPPYIGQCATYFCEEHRAHAPEQLKQEADFQWSR